ncbi:MAG: putative lipid II flippase FtsW [Sphingomonadaceae bacterium]
MSRGRALSRADRSAFGRWFWTIDHVMLGLVLLLIGCGLIAVAAASPAAAHRYSTATERLADLHFLWRQLMWVAAGLPVLVLTSLLPRDLIRRAALPLALAGLAALALTLVPGIGATRNGASRWLMLGPLQLQPAEFLKPAFILAIAALMARRFEAPPRPGFVPSLLLLGAILAVLAMQPDLGQAVLFSAVWLVLAFLAGLPPLFLGAALAAGAGLLGLAYLSLPHVASRIDRFWTGEGDNYQAQSAIAAFERGGLWGVGPGEGVAKLRLPEAHTDYIFAVIGEEFGAIACLGLAILFAAIVIRALGRAMDEEEPFAFLAMTGLAAQFGLQALINMGVNLGLLPSKGMTLPFISHGGSSFVALCLGMGLLLALGRRNPFEKASPYIARWARAGA